MRKTMRGMLLGVLAALPLPLVAPDAAADQGAAVAVVTVAQAGVYRKAGGKIATQVLSQGDKIVVLSTQPTDGYVSVKVVGASSPGWVRVQDIELPSQPQVLTARPQ